MTPSLPAGSARRTKFSSADLGVAVDGTSQVATGVNKLAASAGDTRAVGSILGREDPLEKGKATRSSILAWRHRGAWWAIHRAAQSWTRLKQLSTCMVRVLFFFFGKEGVNSYLVILKLGLYVCETSENFRGEVWSGE